MLEAERELKKAIAFAAKSALETGEVDHEKLVSDMITVYEKYRYMAADKATDIAEKYLSDCYEQAGFSPVRNSAALKKNAGEWGKQTSAEGIMWGWYKTPDGQTVFVPAERRLEFLRKYHLSDSTSPMQVWDILSENAAEMEERIFAVLEGGRAMGRDAKDIGKDLEAFINYKDGGERVVGRWMSMVSPYKADGTRDEKKIQQGWERAYIEKLNEGKDVLDGDWIQYPSPEAKRILGEPQAKTWIQQKSIGSHGRTLLPPGARAYTNRFGKAGLDYRAIRIIRTESAVNFNERQDRLAETNPASTGKIMRKLDEHRDSWHCLCQEAAKECRKAEGWVPSEILPEYRAPLHPNCFPAGTMIATPEGKKRIEKIKIDDCVMSRDEDTGEVSKQKVTKTFSRWYCGDIYHIILRDGKKITCTPDHQIYCFYDEYNEPLTRGSELPCVGNIKKMEARNFLEGQMVLCYKNGQFDFYDIASIRISRESITVYNITVENTHSYVANGVFVHNCNCQDRPIMKDPKEFLSEIMKEYGLG
jgi:hypothetical protein